ncbi:MAG: DNA gyrase subunit A [Ktedonobacterales bacterium]|nr:DNA gyrase subunit A [Ktedonobacterales bacterium]
MDLGIVKPVSIVEQMTGAYLDYSMSVIVSRALPDVRDGLKPVHRRVLYAMEQMGLQSNKSFRKCAGIVGEVLKEYHPHGDVAVYDTLVRLAQPWNMRYQLVLGQGNFGCFTGDTKISLFDDTDKSFAELAHLPPDEVFPVYSVNAQGRIVVGEGRNARVTRRDAELVEVTLDSGQTIRCTPDHRFMLRDGSYKEARALTPSDSLMPGYCDIAPVREGMNSYIRVMRPATGEYEFAHHLAANPRLMTELAQRSAQAPRTKWSDGGAHQRQVMRQKVAGYVSGLLVDLADAHLTPELYDAHRHSNWIPRWAKASQYFESVDGPVEVATHYNHRVVSVRWLTEREDVYDITVDEHHNFLLAGGVFVHNSIDDDPAAAMRYTEAKMSAIAAELLADIDRDTVDFKDNYDGHSKEPTVLPARLPNLLLNGAAGIAVGMATNIPPHNLREVCDGITYLIDHPDATGEDVSRIIRGPDFPTGGIIQGREGIRSAYSTGRGRIIIRAKAHTEDTERGKVSIIVTELPYQVNKADLVKKISELARDKKIDGITDVRDESDRQGIRVVIELRRDARHISVLNQLFKYTTMQTTFGANVLALVDGQPRVLTLKAILQHYITYRESVISRRTRHDLAKAEARQHILEGLTTALDNLDAVIETIRRSQNRETASTNLRTRFKLTEEQAKAILDMQLGRLAALERRRITDELAEVATSIAHLRKILADVGEVRALIKQDLAELKEKYGDPRRTEIVDTEASDFTEEDLIPNDEVVVTLTQKGYIKRIGTGAYRAQRRGGKGSRGMTTHEDDAVAHLLCTRAHDSLLFFTNKGRVFQLKAYALPDVGRAAKGDHIRNLIGIEQQETVTALVAVPKFVARDFMVMATRRGEVKKTSLDEFAVVRSLGLIAMDLEPGDELIGARLVRADDHVLLITERGQAIRFAVQELRAASRTSGGVRGIRLDEQDRLMALCVAIPGSELLVVTANGYGKRTPIDEYPAHGRGGGGIITARLTDKTGSLAAARILTEEDRDLMIISADGTAIRTDWHSVAQSGRPTQGVRLINVTRGDHVVAITTMAGDEDEASADVAFEGDDEEGDEA